MPSFASLDRSHRQVMQMLTQLTQLVDQVQASGIDDSARMLATAICRPGDHRHAARYKELAIRNHDMGFDPWQAR